MSQATFEAQFMKKLSNIEAELKKSVEGKQKTLFFNKTNIEKGGCNEIGDRILAKKLERGEGESFKKEVSDIKT